jgi:hypothetical protein
VNASQLKPLSQLSQRYGVKLIMYGGPGTGKTPLMATAPRPVMCITEPGLLSVRHVTTVPGWEAYTPDRIDEFFTWLTQSSEAKAFDTVGIDSISQMAELFLTQELGRNKDGRKAYGEMHRRTMKLLNDLYYMPNKHTYLIAKQGVFEEEGSNVRKPYFPGKELNVQVPHMYDEVWHLGMTNVPSQPQPVIAVRTRSTFGTFARDRSGQMAEIEYPELSSLFKKAMS